MLIRTLVAVLAATVAVADVRIDKPESEPKLPGGTRFFSKPLMEKLPPAVLVTMDQWGDGWLPAACKGMAEGWKLPPNEVTAFNVKYGDCDTPWVFCRHKDAETTIYELLSLFSHVPVRMRDFVQHILLVPFDSTRSGMSWGANILLAGPLELSTIIHEIGHNLDKHAYPGVAPDNAFSDYSLWRDTVAKDKAVITGYSQTNHRENLAELTVFAVYGQNMGGDITTMSPNWGQVANQYFTMVMLLGQILTPGGTCNRRFANDPAVWAGNRVAARFAARPPDSS